MPQRKSQSPKKRKAVPAAVRRIATLESKNRELQKSIEGLALTVQRQAENLNGRLVEIRQMAVLAVGGIIGAKGLTIEQMRLLSPDHYRMIRNLDESTVARG